MTKLTTEELAAIRERAESATGGPWKWDFGEEFESILVTANKFAVVDGEGGVTRYPDAEFIAHAREDIPKLLAEIERLRSVIDRTHTYAQERFETTYGGEQIGYSNVLFEIERLEKESDSE